MDQGDGQTHDTHDAPAESQEHAASASTQEPAAEVPPPSARPSRGRKRSPVRVEASADAPDHAGPDHADDSNASADAQTSDSPDPAATADAPPPKEFPSIADRVEAVILSTDRALSPERIAIALGLIPEDTETSANDAPPAKSSRGRKRPQSLVEEALSRVDGAVAELNAIYEQTGRSFRIESVAGGHRVLTMSRYAPDVARLRNAKVSSKLSRAAIETLAIIAYKQPMTRAELEAIRGVSCGEVLKSLLERRLVTIKGRAEELGRPMLYGTTREFLDHFGLASIKDLPTVEELRASAGA